MEKLKPREQTVSDYEKYGWIGTRQVHTRAGTFQFNRGYPTEEAAQKLAETLAFNRAVEVYLNQLHAVSAYNVWKGVAAAGTATANQMVIWESLMDSQTLLLTGNTETVYGLAALDLRREGPLVIELPPFMLGMISDMWQKEIAGIGPTGVDKGEGGRFLLLPPGYNGVIPLGYVLLKCSTFKITLGIRGFLENGRPDKAVALMKTTKIYPLSEQNDPPRMIFVNGSGTEVETIFPDNAQYFIDLSELVDLEPEDALQSHERFLLASIGIEKGISFKPDDHRKSLFHEAAQLGSAIARMNSFASTDEERLVYLDRHWEWAFIGGSASWDSQGYVNTDRRAAFSYIAIGMSPAMVKKIIGGGSQYIWTPRDARGDFLDGGRGYHLHLPPNIPVKNFWSVVVYDSETRSLLRNDEDFPAISQYTHPTMNDDGSIDIYFGPAGTYNEKKNFIRTVPGKGWFPIIRFYGPLEEFFDKSWKPNDIEFIS